MKIFKLLILIGFFIFVILFTYAHISVFGFLWWHIPLSILFGVFFWIVAQIFFSKYGDESNIRNEQKPEGEKTSDGEDANASNDSKASADSKDWLHLKFIAKIKFNTDEKKEKDE